MSMTIEIDWRAQSGTPAADLRVRRYGKSWPRRLAIRIAWAWRAERRRRRRFASTELLSRLDDHILKDIGFTRDSAFSMAAARTCAKRREGA
jgi:uncharacterized protein YjiS (DUF1127 family)